MGRKRQTVVVADNDPIIRSVLRALFDRLGCEVRAVADAEAAREAAGPDVGLFVLDLDMPGGGGLDLCRALRGQAAFADVPMVVLTGHAAPHVRAFCEAAGATLYLTKPFNPAALLRAVSPFLDLDAAGEDQLATLISDDRGLQLHDRTAGMAAPCA
jgi:CheY-like chemotaxis protein